jgi:hypothetical protein
MRRKGIFAALLVVGVGVVLGATVFRTDIAQATGLAQSVTVDNTTANPVPVREQNLDGGNIKVHEEGTAAVRSANEEVSVHVRVFDCSYPGPALYTVPAGQDFILEYTAPSSMTPSRA